MAARRRAAPKKKASGANIENWQRKTVAILLRMQPEDAAELRAGAAAQDLELAEYVARLVRADRQIV